MPRTKFTTPPAVEPNSVFDFLYPFVRSTFTEFDDDGAAEIPTWKPGIRIEDDEYKDCLVLADGMGAQIITVIGTYKPGKFPLRIFYTRKWRDPSGKVFGNNACRVASIRAFRSIIGGYRHPFEVLDAA